MDKCGYEFVIMMKGMKELVKSLVLEVKGPDSIIHGIQKLQEYEIIVHPSCQEVITEFENYSWQKDKKTGEYINKPVDQFNHCMDALRYSLQCVGRDIKFAKMLPRL